MRRFYFQLVLGLFFGVLPMVGEAAPVPRSSSYQGLAEDVMNFDYQPWMNASVAMTVEAWVYREDAGRCETIISHNYKNSFWLGFCPQLRFYRSGGASADADVAVPAGQWTHVAASYTGSRVQFYINGVLAGDKALANSGAGSDNELNIGGSPEGLSSAIPFGYYFQGYLDEIRVWSVARTQAEIQSDLYSETRSATGLVAAFGLGSYAEEVHSHYSNMSLSFDRISGFGILPRNLRVPRTTSNILLDGVAQLSTEYAGAEQMVIRYNDGAAIRDAVAYLVYRDNSSNPDDRHLYVAVRGLKPAQNGRSSSESFFNVQVDPNNSGGVGFSTGDFYVTSDLNGVVGAYERGATFTFPPIASGVQTWQAGVTFCDGEFLPACLEFRIHENLLGSFDNVIGLAMGQLGIEAEGDSFMAPSDALSFSSRSFPDLVFGGNANTGLKPIVGPCLVSNILTRAGMPGQVVRLYQGTSSQTGILIWQGTTDSFGSVYVSGQAMEGQPVTLSLGTRLDYTYLEPLFGSSSSSSVLRPVQTNFNWEVVYNGCTNASGCNFLLPTFRVYPPPPPLALNSFDPTNGAPPVVLRSSPPKALGGATVRLHGSNLHDRVRVYLTQCNLAPTDLCAGSPNHYQVGVVGRSPTLEWIDVEIPEVPPAGWGGGYRWLIEDLWVRTGYRQWNYAAAGAGMFTLGEHAYPKVYGFEFANTDDSGSVEAFEGTYGESVFSYLPFPPFKIRDSYYYGVWFPIYMILMEASNGSCYGMAATSRLFAQGNYQVSTYDQASLGAGNGVRYPAGFVGSTMCSTNEFVPCGPKPGIYSGLDVFNPFRPLNLWAQINVNMGVQFSSEAIAEVLGQGRDGEGVATIGDPVGVLTRIESRPRGYVVCIKPSDGVTGHCVTPLGVEHGFKLNAEGLVREPNPDYSLIHIYDNNWPESTRYIEVNRVANLFRYRLGNNRDGTPKIWEGSRIYTYSMGLFTSRRHAPSFDIVDTLETLMMMVVGGQADAIYVDRSIKKTGWDFSGRYFEQIPGAGMILPYANPLEDRDVRTGMFLTSRTNPPVHAYINNKGSYYAAFAGVANVAIQLERFDARNGYQDDFQPSIGKEGQLSVFYTPEWPANLISPKIAMSFQTNSRAVFRLEELNVPAAAGFHFEADPARRGISLYNDAAIPLSYRLKIDAFNESHAPVQDGDYGTFTVAPGGTQNFLWHEWPRLAKLQVETDENSDGILEKIEWVDSPFAFLNIALSETEVILTWEAAEDEEFLVQYAVDLGPSANWTTILTPHKVDGNLRELILNRHDYGSQTFFRLSQLPAPARVVLAVDFNDRSDTALTHPGFSPFVIGTADGIDVQTTESRQIYGDLAVALRGVGGDIGYDDRVRDDPQNNGDFTESLLLRDFVFSRALNDNGGLDVVVDGLEPDKYYEVRLWSFNYFSAGTRVADWFANHVLVASDYTFDGREFPSSNEHYQMSFRARTDADGALVISGRRDSTSVNELGQNAFGVFINALMILDNGENYLSR